MREVLTVIKGNYRKNKAAYISIAILMLIVSMVLTAVLSILLNTARRDKQAIESVGFGHIVAAVRYDKSAGDYGKLCEELVEKIEECPEVEKVDRIPCLFMELTDLNGKSGNSTVLIYDYQSEYVSYPMYDEMDENIEKPVLNPSEISVPVSFQSLYNCSIGDNITLTYFEKEYTFRIVSFLEDPYMGSSMMGIKTLLLCEEDMNRIMEEAEYKEPMYTLSIFREEDSELTDVEFDGMLNKETSYASYSWITFSGSQMYTYMTMQTDIFGSILIGFAIMLVIATIIVLNNNISNSIEQDYVNLGVLKAVGMPNDRLKLSILLGYVAAGLLGAIIGIPVAIPIIDIVNDLIRPSIGLYVENRPEMLLSGLILLAIFLVLVAFIQIKLRKISHITPVSAIYGGRADIYFSSLFKLPITRKFQGVSLAYRNLVSGKKQYIGAVLVTAILVLFMTMISDMCLWFGGDGEKLAEMFTPVLYDVRIWTENEDIGREIDGLLDEYAITDQYEYYNQYVMVQDTQMWCGISTDPEQYHNVYEGRTCTYENEILITEVVAENYGLAVGDAIEVGFSGESAEYIVSGIYQCPNDSGKNISMSYEGFRRLVDGMGYRYYVYQLEDKAQAKEIVELINETYSEEQAEAFDATEMDDSMKNILNAINGIAVIIYVVAGIFVIITVVLVCGKIFAKEKQDYGIYKSMGFTSVALRRQFAIRFAIVAFIGSIAGIGLTVAFSGDIIGALFMAFGITNYDLDLHLTALIVPVVFMTAVFCVVAYLVSGRMKKVTPRVLITE